MVSIKSIPHFTHFEDFPNVDAAHRWTQELVSTLNQYEWRDSQ